MTLEKPVLVMSALACTGFALWFGARSSLGAMGYSTALAGAFLVMAYIRQIATFSLGWKGVSATTKTVAEIQIQLDDLQQLAAALARAILTTAEGAGRMGGIPDDRKTAITDQLLAALERIRLPSNLRSEMFEEVNEYVAFDYAHNILGASTVPTGDNQQLRAEWSELRSGGLSKIATPEEIETFLSKYSLLNDDRRELLADYRYFLEHRKHRRPGVWRVRKDWGRL